MQRLLACEVLQRLRDLRGHLREQGELLGIEHRRLARFEAEHAERARVRRQGQHGERANAELAQRFLVADAAGGGRVQVVGEGGLATAERAGREAGLVAPGAQAERQHQRLDAARQRAVPGDGAQVGPRCVLQRDDGAGVAAAFHREAADLLQQLALVVHARDRGVDAGEQHLHAVQSRDVRFVFQLARDVAKVAAVAGELAAMGDEGGAALEPAERAVAMRPARTTAAHRILAARRVGQQQRRAQAIVRVQQRDEAAADDRVGLEAHELSHGAVGEREAAFGVELEDPVLGGLDDVAQPAGVALQLLLGGDARAVVGRFVQRAHHGARQAAEAALQHVVGGAALQRIDGAIFTEGAGHEHEGQPHVVLPHDLERFETAEARQREIGQDDVGPELMELLAKVDLRVDAPGVELRARALQRARDQVGIDLLVFDQQQLDRLRHDSQAIFRFCSASQALCWPAANTDRR